MIFCEKRPYQNANDPEVHPVFRGRMHVHLMSDDEYELRIYAQSIGLKARWLQRDSYGLPHFDCTGRFMTIVLADDKVVKMERDLFVATYRALRLRNKQE